MIIFNQVWSFHGLIPAGKYLDRQAVIAVIPLQPGCLEPGGTGVSSGADQAKARGYFKWRRGRKSSGCFTAFVAEAFHFDVDMIGAVTHGAAQLRPHLV